MLYLHLLADIVLGLFSWLVLFLLSGAFLELTEGTYHPWWLRPVGVVTCFIVLLTMGIAFLIMEHSYEETDQVIDEWGKFFTRDIPQIVMRGYW